MEDAKANPEQADLQLVGPLRRLAHPDRAACQGGRQRADAAPADHRRRPGRHRGARRQRQFLHVADVDCAPPYQVRQGAAVGGVQRHARRSRCPRCRRSRSKATISNTISGSACLRPKAHPIPSSPSCARRSTRRRTARSFLGTLDKLGQELAYMDQPAFASFWAADAKKMEDAVNLIGRVQG